MADKDINSLKKELFNEKLKNLEECIDGSPVIKYDTQTHTRY